MLFGVGEIYFNVTDAATTKASFNLQDSMPCSFTL